MTTTIKATHTPGPWKPVEAGVLAENLTSYGNWYVCAIIDPDNEEHKANMRLIAAAPDLLAQAEQCVAWYRRMSIEERDWPEFAREALAAIAKARATS